MYIFALVLDHLVPDLQAAAAVASLSSATQHAGYTATGRYREKKRCVDNVKEGLQQRERKRETEKMMYDRERHVSKAGSIGRHSFSQRHRRQRRLQYV